MTTPPLLPPFPPPMVEAPHGHYPRRGVLVDWYRVRTQSPPDLVCRVVDEAFLVAGLVSRIQWHREAGREGFAVFDVMSIEGFRLGHVASGGRNVAGWVHIVLTGQGCGLVGDWDRFDQLVRQALAMVEHRRVDLALDVFDGSITYEYVEAAWELGGFDPVRGARPKRGRNGYPETGRTFTVGDRKTSDRFFRNYEKGFEVGHHIWGEGFDLRLWFRCEVELKPVNGPIPSDVIQAREAFFAGAAPLYAALLGGVQGRRAVRDPVPSMAAEVAEAVRVLRRQAGPMLAVLRDVYGSDEALVAALVAGAVPSRRLIEGGAKLLTRDDLVPFGV